MIIYININKKYDYRLAINNKHLLVRLFRDFQLPYLHFYTESKLLRNITGKKIKPSAAVLLEQ